MVWPEVATDDWVIPFAFYLATTNHRQAHSFNAGFEFDGMSSECD